MELLSLGNAKQWQASQALPDRLRVGAHQDTHRDTQGTAGACSDSLLLGPQQYRPKGLRLMEEDLQGAEEGTQDFRRSLSAKAGLAERREGELARQALGSEFCETVRAPAQSLPGCACVAWSLLRTFAARWAPPRQALRRPVRGLFIVPDTQATRTRELFFLFTGSVIKVHLLSKTPEQLQHSRTHTLAGALEFLPLGRQGQTPQEHRTQEAGAGLELSARGPWPMGRTPGGPSPGLSSPDAHGRVRSAVGTASTRSSSRSGPWLTLVLALGDLVSRQSVT